MKVIITGGAGFIGSHITEELVARDPRFEIHIIDNLSSGKIENIAPFQDKIGFHQLDIRDLEKITPIFKGTQVVFHQAALVSVPKSIEDPLLSNGINCQGTINVLLAAKTHGVKRIVFASSAAVYGQEPTLPKKEAMLPAPISPYAIDKLSSEYYLKAFHYLFGIEAFILRYFNVFGPRQDPKSPYSGVMSIFVDRLQKGVAPCIYGDGEQTRDFVYVKDVVQANIKAGLESSGSQGTFNVARQEPVTINQIFHRINQLMGKALQPIYAPARSGDIRHSLADISLAQEQLGYHPQYGLEEGLKRYIESTIKSK